MGKISKTEGRWTLSDVIDLEVQRLWDREQQDVYLENRDREVYHSLPNKAISSGELLLGWLRKMREQQPAEVFPGKVFSASITILLFVLLVFGWVTGIGSGYLALRYDGAVPVNVSIFLGVIVVPQVLLLLGYLPVALLVSLKPSWATVLYALPLAVGRRLLKWIWKWALGRVQVSADQHDSMRLYAKDLTSVMQQHGGLFANQVFKLIQIAGVAFNVGVLCGCLILLLFTDRAFGWQSSLVESPEQVERIVTMLSSPWSFLGADHFGGPSLEQIAGSRIVLRENSAYLASEDLLAWWPFLLLCVVVYGLLPRLLTWWMSVFNERRLLEKQSFEASGYQRIVTRMKSVSLVTQGSMTTISAEHQPTRVPGTENLKTNAEVGDSMQAWVLSESCERYSNESLLRWVEHRVGHSIGAVRALETLSADAIPEDKGQEQKHEFILMVLEGWQPPIQETLSELKTLAMQLDKTGQKLALLLAGKPGHAGHVRELSDSMTQVWRKKIALLDCGNLQILASESETKSSNK